MAATNFIPTLWSARLLAHLDKNLVLGNLVNRDYEGEIRNYGDTVKINQIGDITVKDYVKGTPIAYEDVSGTDTELHIDQQKYWAFKVEDIDAAQANIALMDRSMERASYKLRDTVDSFIAKHAKEAGNQIEKTALTTPESAYDALVKMSVALDEANVPEAGRWAVVPPWFYGLILKDDRFIASGTEGAANTLATGRIGSAAAFTVYKSNNLLVETDVTNILAGTNAGITFAQQILKTESLRLQEQFADAVRGLLVFGDKVVQPKALVCLKAAQEAGD